MKRLYILRHANWDLEKDRLTDEGKQKCLDLQKKLGNFDNIISSPFERSQETAKLLTSRNPRIEEKAGILQLTNEQNERITELRQKHPLGVAGAIFTLPELRESIIKAGQDLMQLIQEIIIELPQNGKALIISHDGTMVAAEKIIKNESFTSIEKTYHELEGFVINEQ